MSRSGAQRLSVGTAPSIARPTANHGELTLSRSEHTCFSLEVMQYVLNPVKQSLGALMLTWYAIIRLADTGAQQRVTVKADSYWNARQMLEALYGREAVVFGPNRADLMRAI